MKIHWQWPDKDYWQYHWRGAFLSWLADLTGMPHHEYPPRWFRFIQHLLFPLYWLSSVAAPIRFDISHLHIYIGKIKVPVSGLREYARCKEQFPICVPTSVGTLYVKTELLERARGLMHILEETAEDTFSIEDLFVAAGYLRRQAERERQMREYKATYNPDYAADTSSVFSRLMRQGDIVEGKTVHFTPYDKEDPSC